MKIITQINGTKRKERKVVEMKKLTILAVLATILTVSGGNVYALPAEKFGPTLHDPAPVPLPTIGLDSEFPSII